jgi:hypothetical protein
MAQKNVLIFFQTEHSKNLIQTVLIIPTLIETHNTLIGRAIYHHNIIIRDNYHLDVQNYVLHERDETDLLKKSRR